MVSRTASLLSASKIYLGNQRRCQKRNVGTRRRSRVSKRNDRRRKTVFEGSRFGSVAREEREPASQQQQHHHLGLVLGTGQSIPYTSEFHDDPPTVALLKRESNGQEKERKVSGIPRRWGYWSLRASEDLRNVSRWFAPSSESRLRAPVRS